MMFRISSLVSEQFGMHSRTVIRSVVGCSILFSKSLLQRPIEHRSMPNVAIQFNKDKLNQAV
jgi:hypothetical protein